jgi:hypothetical protein
MKPSGPNAAIAPSNPKTAPATTDRDRKELLRTLLEEVKISLLPEEGKAHLLLRCKTSAISELDVVWRAPRPAPIRTDEETIELLRRFFHPLITLPTRSARKAGGRNRSRNVPTPPGRALRPEPQNDTLKYIARPE